MKHEVLQSFRERFGGEPSVVTRAPGRIEFVGNHTDYNGGVVLGAAIDRGIWIAARKAAAGRARLFSQQGGKVVDVALRDLVRQSGAASWTNYPLGVWANLRSFGLPAVDGFELAVASNLPLGAGLSSSAAFELAAGLAFCALSGEEPNREILVMLGKKAENEFVGVPCGILDQGVSGFGRKNHLVLIDCRFPTFATVPMPSNSHFWVFNTHTKHALVDGLYATRHRECMDAAKALGVAWLADASSAQLERDGAKLSTNQLRRARHVVEEIDRVNQVRHALSRGDISRVGHLLTASHRSSQTQFENSTVELDHLVDLLVDSPSVFGARLTGGGFGGAVMALTSDDFGELQANAISEAYASRFGSRPEVFHLQTDDGAVRLAT